MTGRTPACRSNPEPSKTPLAGPSAAHGKTGQNQPTGLLVRITGRNMNITPLWRPPWRARPTYNHRSDPQTDDCRRARGGFLAFHALQTQRKTGFCGALSETIVKGTRVVAMPNTVIAPVEALPRFVVHNEFKGLSARTARASRHSHLGPNLSVGAAARGCLQVCSRSVPLFVPGGQFRNYGVPGKAEQRSSDLAPATFIGRGSKPGPPGRLRTAESQQPSGTKDLNGPGVQVRQPDVLTRVNDCCAEVLVAIGDSSIILRQRLANQNAGRTNRRFKGEASNAQGRGRSDIPGNLLTESPYDAAAFGRQTAARSTSTLSWVPAWLPPATNRPCPTEDPLRICKSRSPWGCRDRPGKPASSSPTPSPAPPIQPGRVMRASPSGWRLRSGAAGRLSGGFLALAEAALCLRALSGRRRHPRPSVMIRSQNIQPASCHFRVSNADRHVPRGLQHKDWHKVAGALLAPFVVRALQYRRGGAIHGSTDGLSHIGYYPFSQQSLPVLAVRGQGRRQHIVVQFHGACLPSAIAAESAWAGRCVNA